MNYNNPYSCQLSQGVHLIDQATLERRADLMKRHIWPAGRGGNFYAVKGNPNHHILKTLHDQGFGFDCSSPTEILDALVSGARPGEIIYTANATPWEHLKFAMDKGAILNLDDIAYLKILERTPRTLSFRVNIAGIRKDGGQDKIIGKLDAQKYGVPYENIFSAFRKAKEMGVEEFGLHTMYATNNRDWKIHFKTLQILLEIAKELEERLDIRLKFVNAGGGIGNDYKSPDDPSAEYGEEDKPFDLFCYGSEVNNLLWTFEHANGWRPDFLLECARYAVAPAGIWVAPVVAVVQKYRLFACIGACDGADLLRAGIYPAHHHVIVLDREGKTVQDRPIIKQSIVGPLCENIHAASQRLLPRIIEGDLVVFCDTACYGIEMGMNYNGWTKSAQVMLKTDGELKVISRAQTIADIRCLQVSLE